MVEVPISPTIGVPSRDHWLPLAALDVSVTLPPAQNVVGPPGVMVGCAGIGLIGTLIEFDWWQPFGRTTFSTRPTLPDAPAVYVTVCVVPPPVMEPLVIDQEYVVAPAGPLAALPVELAQTCAGVGVIGGVPLQSTSLKQRETSLSVGVRVLSVVARIALYSR